MIALLTFTLLSAQPAFEQPNPRLAPVMRYPQVEAQYRWVQWPFKLSVGLGTGALMLSAMMAVFTQPKCDFLCLGPRSYEPAIGTAITGAFLFATGVVMLAIVSRHNEGLPEDD